MRADTEVDVELLLPVELAGRPETEAAGENRRDTRFALRREVRLLWMGGDGLARRAMARGVDMSAVGAGVAADQALAVGTQVCIELPVSRVVATGAVRYCHRAGTEYRIGVAFGGPLAWVF